MAGKSGDQKIKLLKLYEILSKKTDEDHPMSTSALTEALAKEGISCDRRTLYNDIKYLTDHGYEISEEKQGHNNVYYVVERMFEENELKILIDAIQACAFLPKDNTDRIVDKIAHLSSDKSAEILKENIVNFNPYKHSNKSVMNVVGTLRSAIVQKKRVQLTRKELDRNGDWVTYANGKVYEVDPLALVFRDDRYYLVTLNYDEGPDANPFRHFRVDRIKSATSLDVPLSDKARKMINSKALRDHVNNAVHMYSGKSEKIMLKFDSSLLSTVFDKFGEQLKINISSDIPFYTTEINAEVSGTLFGWVAQFKDKMTILQPKSVRDEYIKHIQDTLNFIQK